ncbi:MAG: hypothetical protein U1D55_04575 [Phycisphaerae bacterium]
MANVQLGYAGVAASNGWAVARKSGSSWIWDPADGIDGTVGLVQSVDPSVAYNPLRDRFLLCGLINGSSTSNHDRIGVADFTKTISGGTFGAWRYIDLDSTTVADDFPHIVAGMNGLDIPAGAMAAFGPTFKQEYYIVWHRFDRKLYYAHSTDDGANWVWGSSEFTAGEFLGPAVYQDGPVLVSFKVAQFAHDTVRLAFGLDNPDGTVTWSMPILFDDQLRMIDSIPVVCKSVQEFLPRFTPTQTHGETVAWLAADPTNPTRFFMVYHAPDVTQYSTCPPFGTIPDVDVNVYLREITLFVEQNAAVIGPPIRVNDPDPPNAETPSDQFNPAVRVDQTGRVHVVFYDDRDWPSQRDGNSAPDLKFNVFYASRAPGQTTFGPQRRLFELVDSPTDPPAGNRNLLTHNGYELGEYLGLDVFRDAFTGAVTVWAGFCGSTPNDEHADKSVIWASRVNW